MTTIETIVTAVFTLPDLPAAMTFPLLAATIRIELTRNSRAIMMTTATEEASPSSINCDQRRKNQHLVGHRVEELAEIGNQVPAAGDMPVEGVGDRSGGEDNQRPKPMIGNRVHQKVRAGKRAPE